VHRLICSWHMVAFKMGRRQGARRGLSESIRNRRATQPPAHFQRNPAGRGQLAVFRVARSTVMIQIAALRSRLEKQPTDLRPYASYIRDDALERGNGLGDAWLPVREVRASEKGSRGIGDREAGSRISSFSLGSRSPRGD
jgi:hypothetical protein